ncbi:IclR family transcriptional regulator [Luteipulveratus halotolerans]|uniref:IclR family transcriptional regulator n=1 Tax=Luteipulveratus halotolerans TaxID=1631356 RepID=A0A0L6CL36_9MICO|nr:IclR family transcriptional regulator [Luteipulveratus halotolerans]KNX38462.1 IclR family transcriptional regulator [Luteipulveratus halotolerans]
MTNAPAAAQAIAVLQLLARHAEPMPAAAIARDLGLPRSSTYHLLSVLRDAGFVSHLGDDRRWGLGVAAFELGSAYARQAPLQRISRPVLTRLVDQTTHNAHLVVLHGRDVLYVIEERAQGRPSLVTDVGVRLPAQLTASGLAILAALPPQQVRALYASRDDFVQRHGQGPLSLSALRSELSQVRTRGYAAEQDSVTPGLASVGAAALDHNGHPAAGIAVTFPHERVSEDERSAAVDAVRRAAADLSRRLGHRAP